jgi:hypothetical protein
VRLDVGDVLQRNAIAFGEICLLVRLLASPSTWYVSSRW